MNKHALAVLLQIFLLSTWLVVEKSAYSALPAIENRMLTEPSYQAHSGSSERSNREQSGPLGAAGLELLKRIEFLEQEVQELRGKVEEQAYQLSEMQKNTKKASVNSLKEPSSSLLPAPTDNSVDLDKLEQHSKANMVPSSDSAEKLAYDKAYGLIKAKQYGDATMEFRSFVKTFPHSQLVANSYYWLGELYLVHKKLDQAQMAFEKVVTEHPQHPKVIDSLLKLGIVQYSKGDWQLSKETFTKVAQRYPGSESARLAAARIEKMQQDGRI